MESGVGRIQLVMVSYLFVCFYLIIDYEYMSYIPIPSFPSVIIFCSDLSIGNGFVIYNNGITDDRPDGTTATYFCFSGYILRGETTRICERDGTWNEFAPVCQGE